jgi:hypothetical protein
VRCVSVAGQVLAREGDHLTRGPIGTQMHRMTETVSGNRQLDAELAVLAADEGPPRFGFYDMFCGIGAFHLAAAEHGGTCLGACDNDRFVKQTYHAWYGMVPEDDVRTIGSLPIGTDVLLAGFPCPTFSLAGKSKLRSLGRKEGLQEWRRGQLIFEISRIVACTDPGLRRARATACRCVG